MTSVGTDIISITRIEAVYHKYGSKFLCKNFHPLEIEKFHTLNKNQKMSFLAKRFAAKEAIAKALKIGIGKLAFSDIAIINDKNGAPKVKVDSGFEDFDKYDIHISLSDDYPFAIAFALINNFVPS